MSILALAKGETVVVRASLIGAILDKLLLASARLSSLVAITVWIRNSALPLLKLPVVFSPLR